MGAISSSARSIEDDYKDIQQLFQAAKFGNWPQVQKILGTSARPGKPYRINLIPEDRRWGLLQQAVYWNNTAVTRHLLSLQECDKNMQVKDGVSEKGPTGACTAEDIAKLFGRLEISRIIANHVTPCDVANDMDTFYKGPAIIENEAYGLFRLTLAAYKMAFHPSPIDQKKPLSELLNDIFSHVSSGRNWMTVRDRVSQSLFPACKEASKCIEECTTRKDFYKMIINVYTDETTQLYTYLNTALRRQRDFRYKPTAKDLALGPYMLMFHILLFCWNTLQRESKTTYRKMKVSDDDLKKYKRGTKFTWLSFVSSSVQRECAQIFPSCEPSGDKEVHFVIDNALDSQWKPLNIEDYACYTEKERVYPAGATFEVTRRSEKNGVPIIRMKLLNSAV